MSRSAGFHLADSAAAWGDDDDAISDDPRQDTVGQLLADCDKQSLRDAWGDSGSESQPRVPVQGETRLHDLVNLSVLDDASFPCHSTPKAQPKGRPKKFVYSDHLDVVESCCSYSDTLATTTGRQMIAASSSSAQDPAASTERPLVPVQRVMQKLWRMQAGFSNLLSMGAALDIEATQVPTHICAVAEYVLQKHCQALDELATHCRDLVHSGLWRPVACISKRKYDETPLPILVPHCNDYEEDFVMETAKLMLVESEVCVLMAQTATGKQLFLRKELPVQLRSLESNAAHLIVRCLRDTCILPDSLATLFQGKLHHLAITDDHPANGLAESCFTAGCKHRVHWRCLIHKAYPLVARSFELVPGIDSRCIKLALVLRNSGALSAFRRGLRQVLQERVVLLKGVCTSDDTRHRELMMSAFFVGSRPIDKYNQGVVRTLLNGNWRNREEIEVYVRRGEHHRKKVVGVLCRHLVKALAGKQPKLFPRGKWTGVEQTLQYFGILEAAHGLLSAAFRVAFPKQNICGATPPAPEQRLAIDLPPAPMPMLQDVPQDADEGGDEPEHPDHHGDAEQDQRRHEVVRRSSSEFGGVKWQDKLKATQKQLLVTPESMAAPHSWTSKSETKMVGLPHHPRSLAAVDFCWAYMKKKYPKQTEAELAHDLFVVSSDNVDRRSWTKGSWKTPLCTGETYFYGGDRVVLPEEALFGLGLPRSISVDFLSTKQVRDLAGDCFPAPPVSVVACALALSLELGKWKEDAARVAEIESSQAAATGDYYDTTDIFSDDGWFDGTQVADSQHISDTQQ
eukprot:TRINITY_DN47671_c0_g1_i1.p1 TRINITY_DN47671_c0_g1~~TRINITY_DN47671_c0_g1_i1.p1  ORF type:complete len:796 (-),score=110.12 TRINITY_DN47671_c0_g1_i1:303-2690(-)